MYWLEFIISAAVIIFAGVRLTAYADEIAEHMNLGKVWIGVVILGLVTSLPEAITCLVSVVSLKSDDLAIGNLLGSNNFNPMLIVVMDMIFRKGSVTNAVQTNRSHVTSAVSAILLAVIVILEIAVSESRPLIQIGPVSLGTLLICVLYLVGMKRLAALGGGQAEMVAKGLGVSGNEPLLRAWAKLVAASALVVVAAMFLARSADTIAVQTGLGQTFVGSLFLAIVTSLPEMVVTIAALKMGALDLAIGNIFGSNMTNIFIVFLCDLFDPGAILSVVSPPHIVTAVIGIILAVTVILGIRTKEKRTYLNLGIDSIFMILVFLTGVVILYNLR